MLAFLREIFGKSPSKKMPLQEKGQDQYLLGVLGIIRPKKT
jgi:hypothetical protein